VGGGDSARRSDPITSPSPIAPARRSDRSFTFLARLNTTAALGFGGYSDEVKVSDVDFGDTAQLAMLVPADVTGHSESGVFLVPEPDSRELVAAALSALAAITQRRTRA
jgi:hypothetical protein